MMRKMNVSLVVRGEVTKRDLQDLSPLSEFGKISFRRKGEIISRILPPLETNVFIFTFDICDESNVLDFLSIINDLCFDKLKMNNDVKLRFYLQSDDAQSYLMFSKSLIQDIADLNIDVEISFLSWGECS